MSSLQKARSCFVCGGDVYFSRFVMRKDKPDKPAPLQEPYTEYDMENDKEPVYHVCKKKEQSYNYEQESTNSNVREYADEPYTKKPDPSSTSTSAKLVVISREELDRIKDNLETIKQLIEAQIKGQDNILRKMGVGGTLFATANQQLETKTAPNPEYTKGEDVEVVVEDDEESLKKEDDEVVM